MSHTDILQALSLRTKLNPKRMPPCLPSLHLLPLSCPTCNHTPHSACSAPRLAPEPSCGTQVVMLLLGGFAIAGALSKHFIAKSMATAILSRVGRQPHWVLLANMLVATFLSMFISNVAAPVLCFGLVQPILRTYAAGTNPLCVFCRFLLSNVFKLLWFWFGQQDERY